MLMDGWDNFSKMGGLGPNSDHIPYLDVSPEESIHVWIVTTEAVQTRTAKITRPRINNYPDISTPDYRTYLRY